MTADVLLKEKYQVMPDMPPEQFEALKADITERGVLVPIDVDEHGYILDGHHRYRACVELGITDFPTIVRPGLSEEDRRIFARKSNMLRRHLNRKQIRELIAEQLAFANGDIRLSTVPDATHVGIRYAPSYKQGFDTAAPPHQAYTAITLAEFLGCATPRRS